MRLGPAASTRRRGGRRADRKIGARRGRAIAVTARARNSTEATSPRRAPTARDRPSTRRSRKATSAGPARRSPARRSHRPRGQRDSEASRDRAGFRSCRLRLARRPERPRVRVGLDLQDAILQLNVRRANDTLHARCKREEEHTWISIGCRTVKESATVRNELANPARENAAMVEVKKAQ